MAGDLSISTINAGPVGGLFNAIINGGFSVNQRAVSGTVTLGAGVYGHDRWKGGSGGCTYTFATVNNVTTITISAGTLVQVIEGINLRSGTYCLSWTGTATGRVDSGSYGSSGSVLGTAVGGTNQQVEFGTGTLSLVQYQFGAVNTLFEARPYGLELALCQRYLPAFNSTGANQGVGIGYINTASEARCWYVFNVEARVPPTGITVPDSTKFSTAWTNNTGGGLTAGQINGITLISTKGAQIYYSISGGTLGYDAQLYANVTGAQILFNGCEL